MARILGQIVKLAWVRMVIVYRVLSDTSHRRAMYNDINRLYKYGCMYVLAALMLVCVDVMVMSSA